MADSDDFYDQTKEVAAIFLDLYLSPKSTPLGQRSPYPDPGRKAAAKKVVSDSEQEHALSEGAVGTAEVPSSFPRKDEDVRIEKARLIAERLKIIGDAVERKVAPDLELLVKEQLRSTSVHQVTLPVFKMMCRTLLSRCSNYLSSGWEQVTAVYMGMSYLVAEIRTEESQATGEQGEVAAAAAVVSPRELQMQEFVGQTLKDLNLDQWMSDQGGMDQITVPQQGQPRNLVNVPIEGTSVDK